ncbi:MAG: class I SAM-dependent methyltransferase [Phycisphaerales bacterium]|jgi:SAM-dependent methyltransferase
MSTSRAHHEIAHGQWLAANDPESVWGWGTPAGRRRAERRAKLIADAAALGPGVRALEIGCGGGMFTGMFAATGASIVAVDISPELIEIAKRRNLPQDRVRFATTRFEEMDPADPFDAVVGSSVLHHLEVERSLQLMYALLKPGGRLAFAEPNLLNPQVWMERRFRHWDRFKYVSPDETAFVRGPLARLLEATGFVDIAIAPHDWLHPSTPRPLIPAIAGVGRALEFVPGVREIAGSLLIAAQRPASPDRRRPGGPGRAEARPSPASKGAA